MSMNPFEYLTVGIAVGTMVARLALFLAVTPIEQAASAA
jgi:hypothetical protein